MVKGGRRFGFAALVVVGDGRGRVGHGNGKAREVPEAIRKATEQAKRAVWCRVPLREGRTLHHDVQWATTGPAGSCCAPPIRVPGIIAGGPMRAIFEALGVHDVVAKSVGTANPHNMIKATFDGLSQAAPVRAWWPSAAASKVSEILVGRREARAPRPRSKRLMAEKKQTIKCDPDRQPDRPQSRTSGRR